MASSQRAPHRAPGIVPLQPLVPSLPRRPRGKRKTPPSWLRAPRDPYGSEHKAVRRYLMALLAATGPQPCPLCGGAMHAAMGRALHLHHSDPAAKLAGLPGDQLAHARCNIRLGGQAGAAIANGGTAPRTATGRPSRIW